jgi:hypothetical protein
VEAGVGNGFATGAGFDGELASGPPGHDWPGSDDAVPMLLPCFAQMF